jgi:hypothetical protein
MKDPVTVCKAKSILEKALEQDEMYLPAVYLLAEIYEQVSYTFSYKPEKHRFDLGRGGGFLNRLNPSSCTVALWVTQTLTETDTWNLHGG